MSNLDGAWRHEDELIVFGDDTLMLGERRFWCEKDGDVLFIFPSQAQIIVPYRVDGDTLRLDVDGVVSVWSRISDV